MFEIPRSSRHDFMCLGADGVDVVANLLCRVRSLCSTVRAAIHRVDPGTTTAVLVLLLYSSGWLCASVDDPVVRVCVRARVCVCVFTGDFDARLVEGVRPGAHRAWRRSSSSSARSVARCRF